ncbi:hypothetical protein LAB1_50310 [Roseibium sp. LAB1]
MAHQGLGGQMENDLGIDAVQGFLQRRPIPDVRNPAVHPTVKTAGPEDARSLVRRQRQADDIGSKMHQPSRKPAALEPCMPRDQNPATGERTANMRIDKI